MFDQLTMQLKNMQLKNTPGVLADNVASTSHTVLDAVVDTNRRVVDAVVAQADKVRSTVAERVTVDERLTAALPTPAQAGARYLEFVERAVAVNRDWNDRVVDMLRHGAPTAAATQPVAEPAPATTTAAPKAPAPNAPATKAPAKKTPAKKVAAKKVAAKKAPAKKAPAKRAAARKAPARKSAANPSTN